MATRGKAKRGYNRRSDEERLKDLEHELEKLLERQRSGRRFSPERVLQERDRLELSAKDYAELVGVSALTIYNWEKGRSQPRKKQLEQWLSIVGMGKREAWRQLDLI